MTMVSYVWNSEHTFTNNAVVVVNSQLGPMTVRLSMRTIYPTPVFYVNAISDLSKDNPRKIKMALD